jgi:hypothetical protein
MTNFSPISELDHPSHEGWWNTNAAPLDPENVQALRHRFDGTGVDAETLTLAVDVATIQVATRRQEAERTNLAKMRLSAAQQDNYKQLAADGDRIGEFVDWFMRASNAVFAWSSLPELDMSHVALEIRGRLQHGDWERAAQLDVLERTLLPAQLTVAGLALHLANKKTGARTYSLMPLYDGYATEDGVFDGVFDYALLRRDRLVGQVLNEDLGKRVEIRKHSAALAVMSQFDPGQRALIHRLFAENGVSYGLKADTTAARIAGEAFEDAVEQRGSATTVIPISANLLVRATRSDYYLPS